MHSRSLRLLAPLLLPFLLGACAMNASNLRLTVHDDGSGDVTIARLRVPETSPLEGSLRGVARTMAFGMEVLGGPFQNIEDLSIGGIHGQLLTEEDGFLFRLTIPLGKDASWIAELGLEPAETARLRELGRTMRAIEDEPEDEKKLADMDLERPSYVFAVKLPGPIESTRLVGREPGENWELSEAGAPLNAREAHLVIPFEDLLAIEGEIVWEIHCGAAEEDAAKEKAKTRRWLGKE